ncbi:BAG family molecular chaperone regulator 1 [Platanthera guangdongensis]|uniref:BAG family molecular chaperone regulator 1 n=1 Tax=Platanthera guangdongensis TaxID=2320717 RepID=A0ABR2MRX2_9ASPA
MLRKTSNKATPPTPSPFSADWEVLPGGMLVQKRIIGAASAAAPPPSIRIRVKHGLDFHEIYISPESTFGEVKKLLWEKTGIHPQEQRLLFKERDRGSPAYLDTAGVKDGSRMIVEEDLTARAKRLLEMRRAARVERAAKSLAAIAIAVDGPVSKVLEMEAAVSRGESVPEKEVAELIELLMAQLLRLDKISVEETEAKRQRGIQVRRVQRNVEKLDMIKLKSSHPMHSSVNTSKQQQRPPVVVTTNWEIFDPAATMPEWMEGACDLIATIK